MSGDASTGDASTDSATVVDVDVGAGSTDGSGPTLPPRPAEQSCRFDGWAPGLLPQVELETIFDEPIAGATSIAVDDEQGSLWVGTNDGRVLVLDVEAPDADPIVWMADESGGPIVGLAVDGVNRFVFVRRSDVSPAVVVERWAFDAAGIVDPESRIRVVRIPHEPNARVGAGLVRDTGGNLIVPVGDGGTTELAGPVEDRSDRRGKILRLDVSSILLDYDVDGPPDNPWVDEPSPADELWALGVRDPSGCTVDFETGALWCTDVGVGASEVTLVEAGAHLGWPFADGRDCVLPSGDCSQVDIVRPDGVYRHGDDDCGSAGGALVRDGDLLDGVVVYGDRCSGAIWAADDRRNALVGRWDAPPVAFAGDANGVAWAVDAEGRIGRVRVVRTDGEFPVRLSASGCFDDLATLAGAPDLVPYELSSPLWTDGAHKQRHIVLPVGERIAIQDDGSLEFPLGTAILKTFSFDFGDGDVRPVETRVMLRRAFAWEFHTYAWNEDGSDAELLEGGLRVELALPSGPLPYDYPSREECGYCHGSSSPRTLGPRLEQLAREVDYGGVVADQLEVFASIDLFDGPLPELEPMASPSDPDADIEARARAYLHSNCGHCHRPGGWAPPDLDMDLRWDTPTPDTNLCGAPTQYYNPWFPFDHRVVPGDPQSSAVWRRLSSRGLGQMPPLATHAVDPEAVVVRDWIASLQRCP